MSVLAPSEWLPRAQAHAARADALTAEHRERRARGERHAVDDFLYEYYGTRPGHLRRWHPGVAATLEGTVEEVAEHASWRWYRSEVTGSGTMRVGVDVSRYVADRGDGVRHLASLLAATASRAPSTGCFGMHEWAMVYRTGDDARRHALPLRLGAAGTDAVVEAHQIRCSHFDAFRFFTPEAVGRNRLQPTRASQVDLEQPGCLHANMDLTKVATKLGPLVPGDLALDCFELARDIRQLDMQASPYDVSAYGLPPVAVETPEGKAEYVARQRAFAERSAPLRARLLTVCRVALGDSRTRGAGPRTEV